VAGGAPFAAAQVPGATGTVLGVNVVGQAIDATNQSVTLWDQATAKLVSYNQTANTDVGLIEAATNTDLSGAAAAVRLMVFSK